MDDQENDMELDFDELQQAAPPVGHPMRPEWQKRYVEEVNRRLEESSAQVLAKQQAQLTAEFKKAISGVATQEERESIRKEFHSRGLGRTSLSPEESVMTKAEVQTAIKDASIQASWATVADNYRREMLSPDVAGKPAKIKEIKQRYQEMGLQTDQISLFGGNY
jgi:hypothetical protein